jgi:hypothetical protein
MQRPTLRYLRGFALDPSFSTRLDTMAINEITYTIRWEDVHPGPIGEYFEVVDFDPSSNCFYDPVDLNAGDVLGVGGFHPSEGSPQFHQQFVYTIAMKTIEHFEHSLGRKILWSPRRIYNESGIYETQFVSRLRIYPHAFRDANAFYDPEKKSILFGYFEAASNVNGNNFPGGVIFTCLSPDIVAHEVTHAILDSIHPRFIENTNPDVAAFHEGFADIVALLQRFAITELVEHQIAQTRGNLGEFSFLGELATQFGNALQNSRGALRGAIGRINPETNVWEKYKPDPERYQQVFEPHERGAILVAIIFDAFIRIYNTTTADLIRIATNGTGILAPGAIHPDLVKRLSATASEIAQRILHICIRALDYCPPVDITFGEYLRAMITADLDSNPYDKGRYRIALIEAFRSWGVFPDRVNTLSIESLQWHKPAGLSAPIASALHNTIRMLKDKVREILELSSLAEAKRREIFNISRSVQAELHTLFFETKRNVLGEKEWTDFICFLGLTNKPLDMTFQNERVTADVPPIEVHNVRPVIRVGREGRAVQQVFITITQTFRIKSGSLEGARFRGGCTLILDMSQNFEVDYVIYKNIRSKRRFENQMNYQTGNTNAYIALTDSTYEEVTGFETINFAHLHFHDPH